MALANYTDLLTSIGTWTNRSDLTSVAPDFVTMAESAISRDLRLRKQITQGTISLTASVRYAALPTDWIEFENVSLGTTPEKQLSYVTVEQLDVDYPTGGTTGEPHYYTIEGDNILFGPTPDSSYSVTTYYYARFAALASSSTNWLMTNHPGVYLHRCLYHAWLYLLDEKKAATQLALYEKACADLQMQDDRAQHSGSVLRVRKG